MVAAMRTRAAPSVLSALVASALALTGCKTNDPPTASGGSQGEVPTKPAPSDASPPADAPPPPDAPPRPDKMPTQATAGVPLDTLLDFVPAGSPGFAVVRDPAAIFSLLHPFVHATLGTLPGYMTKADDKAGVEKAAAKYDKLRAALADPDVHLDKGMAIVSHNGETVLIYGATKPTALFDAVAKVGDLPIAAECVVLDAAPGYVACAKDKSVAAAYAPGKAAKDFRVTVTEGLPGVDLAHANIVGFIEPLGSPFVVQTPPGLLQISFGAQLPPEALKFASPGPATALGLVDVGAAFVWGRMGVEPLTTMVPADAPPFAAGALAALTGEVLLANLADATGAAVLFGVKDQAPINVLIAVASTQLSKLPKVLPDGSGLTAAIESVELAGAKTQVLHAHLTPSAASAASYAALNLKPDGWAFGAGAYAGWAFGADLKGLDSIARAKPAGPTAALTASLPRALGSALDGDTVVLAVHLPFDGLGVVLGKSLNEIAADQLPPDLAESGVDILGVMRNIGTTLAPLSSVSQWTQMLDGHAVSHVAIGVFGDARDEEGKAALAVIDKLLDGEDAEALYGGLADAHSTSPRAHAYKVRAGRATDGALISTGMLGLFAAIAVPAFVKYKKLAEAGGRATPGSEGTGR